MQGRLGNFSAAIDLCEQVGESDEHRVDADSAAVSILHAHKPSEAQPTRFAQWQKERARVEADACAALRDKNPKDVPAAFAACRA